MTVQSETQYTPLASLSQSRFIIVNVSKVRYALTYRIPLYKCRFFELLLFFVGFGLVNAVLIGSMAC